MTLNTKVLGVCVMQRERGDIEQDYDMLVNYMYM